MYVGKWWSAKTARVGIGTIIEWIIQWLTQKDLRNDVNLQKESMKNPHQ